MKLFSPRDITPGIVFYAGYDRGCSLTIVHAKPKEVSSKEKLHFHSQDSEYFLVLHGKITVEVDGKAVDVDKNTCLETQPKEIHKIVSMDKNTEYLVIRTNTLPGEKIIVE